MFCKMCGNQIDDGAKFCPNCGASNETGATTTAIPIATPVVSAGFNETTVIEVSKDNEQKTIQRQQCFGWILKNNQEVNVTSVSGGGSSYHGTGSSYIKSTTTTYVKLTFERNTGINNFAALDELYRKFKNIQDEYRKAELALQVKDFDSKLFLIVVVICAVIGMMWGITRGLGGFFGFIGILYPALLGSIIGMIPGIIIGMISGKSKKTALKKRLEPQMVEMDNQMNTLANNAAQLLR